MKKHKHQVTFGLTWFYLVLLIWIVLFKMAMRVEQLPDLRGVNVIPFAQSAIANGQIDLDEILGNVIIFIPLGVYFSLLRPRSTWIKRGFMVFGISLAIEVLQYVFAIGASDITDLLMNTLGGLLGIGFYHCIKLVLKGKTQDFFNRLAMIASVLTVVFLTIIMVVNA